MGVLLQHSRLDLALPCLPNIALSASIHAQTVPSTDQLPNRNGTQVLVTHLDPLKETPQRGSVVSCNDTHLKIIFPEKFDLDAPEPWRLDVGRSNVVFERMEEAIRQLHYDPSMQEAAEANTLDREVKLQGTYLRDLLLRSFPSIPNDLATDETYLAEDEATGVNSVEQPIDLEGLFKDDSRIVSWATRYSQPHPVVVEGDPTLENLNPTQVRAAAMMLNNRFSLVQGVRL